MGARVRQFGVFAHGDLQPDHIFLVNDEVTGIT